MKVTLEDALSLLRKYAKERTPVLAAFVTPSVSVARVTGPIHVSIVDGIPPHLIVGKEGSASDHIKFRLSDCEFEYGDFRDEESALKFEGFLVVASRKGDTLSLFEPKSCALRSRRGDRRQPAQCELTAEIRIVIPEADADEKGRSGLLWR